MEMVLLIGVECGNTVPFGGSMNGELLPSELRCPISSELTTSAGARGAARRFEPFRRRPVRGGRAEAFLGKEMFFKTDRSHTPRHFLTPFATGQETGGA